MKKSLVVSAIALTVIGVAGVSSLSASALEGQVRNGTQQGRSMSLESRAAIFGMSSDELQKELETKTMSQIAVEQGMREEAFRAKMTESAKARWEARGLSTEEIAERLAKQAERHAANSADHEFGSGQGGHMGGYGKR